MAQTNQIGQPKEKRRGGRVGSFFLGVFIGLLLTILLLGGVGAFAYFKISPAFLNRHFGAGIDLGSEKTNSLTMNKVVSGAFNLFKNIDGYSLNDLNKDFGIDIGNNIYGIDITDLKDVGFGSLGNAISNKFKHISIYELKDVVTLPESFDKIVSNKNTLHLNAANNKLYKDAEFKEEADFEYTVENGKVIIKNFEPFNIVDGKVEIELRFLPITSALANITQNISTDITIQELKDSFGISLPDYLDPSTKVNEISTAIKKIKVGYILGYTIQDLGQNQFKVLKGEQEITGIMAKIATTEVGSLNEDTINNFTIADIFPDNYSSTGTQSVINLIPADTTFSNIPTALKDSMTNATINKLKEVGVFTEDDFKTGILSLLSEEDRNTCTFYNLPNALNGYVSNAKMSQLQTLGIINLGEDFLANNQIEVEGEMKLLSETTLKEFFTAISNSKVIMPKT